MIILQVDGLWRQVNISHLCLGGSFTDRCYFALQSFKLQHVDASMISTYRYIASKAGLERKTSRKTLSLPTGLVNALCSSFQD